MERHGDYYLALAEGSEIASTGGVDQSWHARMEENHDNLRGALAYALLPNGNGQRALRMCGSLYRFWT